ncbi:MAG TPA: tail fiber domain-containing protein [Saprospiraceae bacterium]|nr:tail fiber domain-containing protein [Saprospiraceae bacterium]
MKRIALLAALLTLFTGLTIAQNPAFDYGVRWGFSVLKPDEFVGYPGKNVSAVVMYKTRGIADPDSVTIVYTETHEGTLDDFSFLRFTIGKGENPSPPTINPAWFPFITHICWTVTVTTDEGDKIITGEQTITSVPRANVAALSLNSERFGNNSWSDQSLTVNEFIDLSPEYEPGLLAWNSPSDNERFIQRINTRDYFSTDKSISGVSGEEIDVVRIGGGGNQRRYVFGPSTPPVIDNLITYCAPSLEDALHFLGVKVAGHRSASVNHNTAAIFADNSESPMSAGVLANAQTWGFYGTAQNGVVGISTGGGNGAGIWGGLGQAPDSGGFKYGLFGNSQNFTGGWGAAIFGNGFYTGTWSMSSDARLKSEIRAQSDALDRIMRLRPSQYRYRQDTPYSLPDGIHHGFLAQEMEEVFPELVSDVTMPLSTDPQEMYSSGTIQYKAINYIEMITILTSALQEMNAKIDAQAKEIAELREALGN